MAHFTLEIPGLRTVSEANRRGHWSKHNQRTVAQRTAGFAHGRILTRHITGKPSRVRLVRIAPRSLDSDNLPQSMKAIRDGIADAFKTDDSERAGIVWEYDQERGEPKTFSVRIEAWP